jgi:hypothetical protein
MSITSIISSVMGAYGVGTKKDISSFCFLETSDGSEILVAKDGSLATVIRIDGIKQIIGDEEMSHIIESMNTTMSTYFKEEGHAIQVWFARDPDLSAEMVRDLVSPARRVAKSLSLDLEDVFAERERHLPKFVVWEGFYIVLWTRLSLLTKREINLAKEEMKVPKVWPGIADTQDPFRVARILKDRHRAFVSSFLVDLKDIGSRKDVSIRAEALDVHEALKAMKWSIYPDLIGADWRATMPGDPLRERVPEINDFDASHLLWPRIETQLFDREAETINPRIVRIGNRYFAGLDMTIGPQTTLPFAALLQRMIELDEFPWRISFLIEGNGLKNLNIKQFLASIFQFTNSDNRLIREAIKELRENPNVLATKLRISFATWAPYDPNNLSLIEERAARLQRAAESWGYCHVSPLVGDPLAAVVSTMLGINVAPTAPAGAVPLPEVISMLPWNRDASPWKFGSVLFRTPDGRPWPYQPGSSLQDTFIDLIFAPPGKGKSVYMNTTALALCLSHASTAGTGGAQLPRIAIIDVGPSSSGLISLLQEALPIDRRHEVAYHRLRMIHENAINPFDTQLGCRYPLPLERAFLVNFLTTLGTEAGQSSPPEGLTGIVGAAIDAVYEKLDDRHEKGVPLRYNPGESLAVDRAIAAHNIDIVPGVTCWWNVVDKLFQKGDIHHAILAQRHAVPRLEHLMTVLRSEQVMDVHGRARIGTGELLVDVLSRVISTAVREFPILQRPTQFDIGDARVVALDLDEVAPKGGPSADKQTALMYMLARFVLARDFYLNKENIRQFPEDYVEYHSSRIRRIRETPKRLVYDEFHRTANAPMVRAQVLNDMREGRKWGVHIALASQLLQDFDTDMVDMASGIWIMGVSNERSANDVQAMFGLSQTALEIVKRDLNGPTSKGAPFLAVLNLKEGRHEHLLYNTLGPTEIWAFSTTAEDAALRGRLYDILGPVEARKRLARRFPEGSAKAEIERRVRVMMERGVKNEREAEQGIIEQLVKELATGTGI